MTGQAFRNGPLTGVKVIDLTGVVMGPFGTHILADLGADVVKVESPEGDVFRNYPPARSKGMSGQVLNLHRNKRSVVLDLKRAGAAAALRKLIAGADVLVHNMRPKAIERLGFGYEAVRQLQPGIIYCAAQGFGSQGPYADKAAYDDLIQAISGLASLNQRVHGKPAYVPTVLCDKLAGQAIAYAVSAALYQRALSGEGQQIEVPMFEVAVEFMLVEHLAGAAFIPELGTVGYQRLLTRFRKPFATADGYACILPYSDRNWADFFRFVGRPELEQDPRFATAAERVANVEALYGLLETEASRRTTREWREFCDGVSIPCMPVLQLEEVEHDTHIRSVGLFQQATHPSEGAYKAVRSPVTFSGAPFRVRMHAPRLGEHSDEVLREAGLSEAEIASALQTSAPPRS